MSEGPIDVFFYGLFMDSRVLREAGSEPSNFRRACVQGFALRVGQRATLVPSPGARAYGMLVSMSPTDLERLYGAPGLQEYRPEELQVRPLEGEPAPALCYTLAKTPAPEERNPEYAARLGAILKNLHFPAEYVESVLNS